MEVFTLVGKSGTGKSFHAMNLCKKLKIDGIIDDGLFIYKNTVVEGVSAKKAATMVGAIKTAIFFNDEICDKVKNAIKEKHPKRILILGTSVGMVEKIAGRLDLPIDLSDPTKHINIEDITTLEERHTAREQRDIYGKHVIPAPVLQLKRNFSGYFMDPLRIFRGKDQGAAAERTVVRPTFSYMGDYYVADKVIDDIATLVGEMTEGVKKVIFVAQTPTPEAYGLAIAVTLKAGYPLWETAEAYQSQVKVVMEEMTAFQAAEVNVEVRGIG